MTLDDWKRVALDLKQSYDSLPHIMLWGGEPLVCPFFDELVAFLKDEGFTLGMVTNGVLLDKHMKLCKSAFKTIHVSLDGPKEIHDSIRGAGVFDKVSRNLKELANSDVEVIAMSVLSPDLLGRLEEFPHLVEGLGADGLYLQDYIRLSQNEAEEYKTWMADSFGICANEIDSWIAEMPADYEDRKTEALKRVRAEAYKMPVTYIPHRFCGETCLSPFKHMHISWNGNVMYCTDFYDFSAGNVKSEKVTDIFENDLTKKFREELYKNPACKHCSWRCKKDFYL